MYTDLFRLRTRRSCLFNGQYLWRRETGENGLLHGLQEDTEEFMHIVFKPTKGFWFIINFQFTKEEINF